MRYGRHPYQPSYLYQSGIEPLTKFPIKGIIWYQGESNAHNIPLYGKLFPVLVKSWRTAWGENLPFYFVQLSSMAVGRDGWEEFRNVQRKMLQKIPYTGMAVSSDVGDSTNVHPIFKKQVGERLAHWALANTYHQKVTKSGPLFKRTTVSDNKILIYFEYGKGIKTSDDKPIRTIEIAGKDKKYHPAKVVIAGDHLIATSDQVLTPKFVRYGWSPFSDGNLINEANLPASTFTSEK